VCGGEEECGCGWGVIVRRLIHIAYTLHAQSLGGWAVVGDVWCVVGGGGGGGDVKMNS
jgi:hypothetical protein